MRVHAATMVDLPGRQFTANRERRREPSQHREIALGHRPSTTLRGLEAGVADHIGMAAAGQFIDHESSVAGGCDSAGHSPGGPAEAGHYVDYLMKVNFAIALVPEPNGHSIEPLVGRAVARTRT